MTSPLNIDPSQMMGLLSSGSPATQAAIAQILADPKQMETITGQNKGGSNAWLWQPEEQNTKYQDYAFGGQNNYMTGEVAKYLKALGYSGNAPGGGNISDQDAQSINEFLKARGLSVQTGTHQVPGYSQNTGIQRIIDANGNPLAVDARNNRYDANDRFTDVAKVGALAGAAYGLAPYLTGTAGSTAASAGGGLLSSISESGIGKAVGSIADFVGGGGALAGLVGAGLGAASGGGDNVATSQSKTDPRMDPYIYGDGGYLQALQDKYNANPSGINATMQQGLDIGKANLTDPQYAQTYQNMRSFGNGLLSQPMAGNPFTNGQGGQVPQAGLLANFNDRAKNMMFKGGGLLAG